MRYTPLNNLVYISSLIVLNIFHYNEKQHNFILFNTHIYYKILLGSPRASLIQLHVHGWQLWTFLYGNK